MLSSLRNKYFICKFCWNLKTKNVRGIALFRAEPHSDRDPVARLIVELASGESAYFSMIFKVILRRCHVNCVLSRQQDANETDEMQREFDLSRKMKCLFCVCI